MIQESESPLRQELLERRSRLEQALVVAPADSDLRRLMDDVDGALDRMEKGTFGRCEVCRDPIERPRLMADPLLRFCLDHLTANEKSALEDDIDLASRIQRGLLPSQDFRAAGWHACFHYEGAGPVSGDYCDLIDGGDSLYFVLGDVSGKGVASSLLMAHLHATFRTLIYSRFPLRRIVEQASRIFCESTLPSSFATLICGQAERSGEVHICSAGHPPALVTNGNQVESIGATGIPFGLFSEEHFDVRTIRMEPGDTIFLYTDGLSETLDTSGLEYGTERLESLIGQNRMLPPESLIEICRADLDAFRESGPKVDDLTLMAIRRLSPAEEAAGRGGSGSGRASS